MIRYRLTNDCRTIVGDRSENFTAISVETENSLRYCNILVNFDPCLQDFFKVEVFMPDNVTIIGYVLPEFVQIHHENGDIFDGRYNQEPNVSSDTKSSMYKGTKKFDREQLVFIVDMVMSAAFDKIQGVLPQSSHELNDYQNNKVVRDNYWFGAMSVVGIALPILWAQLNDDGMGTEDFHGWSEFVNLVETYVEKTTDPKTKEFDTTPDCRQIAELFVDNEFQDYLKG